jgi:tetratricopeptide (TPR) repeat protein
MTNLQASDLHAQGQAQFRSKKYGDARRTFEKARELAEAAQNKPAVAEAANDLGVTYQQLKQYEMARKNLDTAISLFAELNDDVKRAQAMGNLGTLLAEMGKYREADMRLEQSAEVFHRLGDRQNESLTLKWLSRVHLKHWDFLGAIFAYERALERLEPLSPEQKLLRRILQIPMRILSRG